jgi:hypothetical protein
MLISCLDPPPEFTPNTRLLKSQPVSPTRMNFYFFTILFYYYKLNDEVSNLLVHKGARAFLL